LRHGNFEKRIQAAYGEGGFLLDFDDLTVFANGELCVDGSLRADLAGRRMNVTVVAAAEKRHVFFDSQSFIFVAIDPYHHAGEGGGVEGSLAAPMPGKVIALLAAPGTTVAKGTPLVVLEAMKMEHTLVAPADGTLKSFCYAVGEQVTDGAELAEFDVAP
jgi:3-methylcrotonyl-CoA carboxylase alpha subunit